jgi:Na+/phosphate symporter
MENIGDIIETNVVNDSHKRLNRDLRIYGKTSDILKEIYKELYLAAQYALEALVDNDVEKALQVMDSKSRFNGMLERAHSHLYVVLDTHSADDLEKYKILNSSIENFRRMHVLFRNIARLIIKGAPPKRLKAAQKKNKSKDT